MKNLRLIPDIHRQQHIVKANFAFDKELIALVKKQTGVRWSQTLKCWYFSKADLGCIVEQSIKYKKNKHT